MLRQYVSITLIFSLIAVGVSGLLMIVLNSFSFQLQMHPVHKVFGIMMVLSGSLHIGLNANPVRSYLKNKNVLVYGAILSVFLILLFVVGLNKPMDQANIELIEQTMSLMESKQ